MNKTDVIIKRLRRLIDAAHKAGVVLVADADSSSIRVMTKEEMETADDLRSIGETVKVDNGCGGGSSRSSGLSCNYGNL